MAVLVAPTDANNAIIAGGAHTLSECSRQLSNSVPFGRQTFEHVDVVVPNLCTAFIGRLIRKVGTARNDQCAIAHPRERAGYPWAIWNRIKTSPLDGLDWRDRRDP